MSVKNIVMNLISSLTLCVAFIGVSLVFADSEFYDAKSNSYIMIATTFFVIDALLLNNLKSEKHNHTIDFKEYVKSLLMIGVMYLIISVIAYIILLKSADIIYYTIMFICIIVYRVLPFNINKSRLVVNINSVIFIVTSFILIMFEIGELKTMFWLGLLFVVIVDIALLLRHYATRKK